MRKSLKRILTGVLAASLAFTSAAVVNTTDASASSDAVTKSKKAGYRAYILFQTSHYLFRDSWFDGQEPADGVTNNGTPVTDADLLAQAVPTNSSKAFYAATTTGTTAVKGFGLESKALTFTPTKPDNTTLMDAAGNTVYNVFKYTPISCIGLYSDVAEDPAAATKNFLVTGGAYPATYVDAYIDHAGTYRVKVDFSNTPELATAFAKEELVWTDKDGGTKNIFNMLGISTDIPREGDCAAVNVSNMKVFFDDSATPIYSFDGQMTVDNGGIQDADPKGNAETAKSPGNYHNFLCINTYDKTNEHPGSKVKVTETYTGTAFDAKPTKSITIQFDIAGDIFDPTQAKESDSGNELEAAKAWATQIATEQGKTFEYVSNRGVTANADGTITYEMVKEEASGNGGEAYSGTYDATGKFTVTATKGAIANTQTKQDASDTAVASVPVGQTITYEGATYVVLTASALNVPGTVALSKSINDIDLEVDESIKDANGLVYNVTQINSNAFKAAKKCKTITVSANVTTLQKNAFAGVKKLKMITLATQNLTAKTVAKNAFKLVASKKKKVTIKCPKKKKGLYTKIIKAKGAKNLMKKKFVVVK